MWNPCCCMSPRIGTFAFAILDIILIGPYIWDVLDNLADKPFQYEAIAEVVLCICVVLFALLLLFGAVQNSQQKIGLWLILWLVFLVVAVLFQIFNITTNSRLLESRIRIGTSFGAILIFIYQLWVVYAYLVELRSGSKALTFFPAKVDAEV